MASSASCLALMETPSGYRDGLSGFEGERLLQVGQWSLIFLKKHTMSFSFSEQVTLALWWRAARIHVGTGANLHALDRKIFPTSSNQIKTNCTFLGHFLIT